MKRSHQHLIDQVTADTRQWVDRAVVGLNLCPFAKAPHIKGLIHYVVSLAESEDALLADLARELRELADAPEAERETTLLMAPRLFADFLDFNDFLDLAEAVLVAQDLDGVLQIAPFHPNFQFAETAGDDITNATNRSPYPTLHLIRESGIDRAVAAFPEAETIYQTNMETMRRLGQAGWAALDVGAHGGPKDQA